MRKIYGMSIRDWKTLGKLLTTSHVSRVETLAEHIEKHNLKTEERTSKRGVRLIKVYFENGVVREYEKAHIDTTKAFGFE